MSIDSSCQDCERGPQGIGGHAHLGLDETLKPGNLAVFWCEECGTRFARTYEGSGLFIWTPLADAQKR
ncbi:MAG TPA: hypothetical protein VM073_09630 [Usitatibacter sp.]|nr:hypothetical protein [Usitatibacter sp.]